ncbi:MAG: L,D-transpeptidase family protein [Actinomycetota bacterium]
MTTVGMAVTPVELLRRLTPFIVATMLVAASGVVLVEQTASGAVVQAKSAGVDAVDPVLAAPTTDPAAPTAVMPASEPVEVDNEIDAISTGSPNVAVVAATRADVARTIARQAPSETAPTVATFTPTDDDPVHFLAVDDQRTLTAGWASRTVDGAWLEVHLPVEPNGTTGWLPLADVELFANPYRVVVDRAEFSLTVLDDGEVALETEVAVGTGATPTPVGTFFTENLIRVDEPGSVYGPYAFVLSGHSESLHTFNGRPAIIGIHGTNDPDAIGSEVSHGCVRLPNHVITDLAEFLPLGTPVEII